MGAGATSLVGSRKLLGSVGCALAAFGLTSDDGDVVVDLGATEAGSCIALVERGTGWRIVPFDSVVD